MKENSRELGLLYEGRRHFRKTFGKKECLHPDAPQNCRGRIVNAHTIQKTGGLTKIAQDGHVLRPDPYTDPTEITRIGINKASTFTGFCEFHDDKLFAPIEKFPLKLTRRHAFLLTFRVISRELFLKRRAVELSVPDGAPFPQFLLSYQEGVRVAIRDLQMVHDEMGKALTNLHYRDTSYFAIEFNRIPGILCSGASNIEYDFHGNRLQYLTRQEPLECITFSLLPFGKDRGVAIFAWFGKSSVNKKFIRSLATLPDKDLPDAFVRFAFQSLENIFLAPNWWNSLSDSVKSKLKRRFDSSFWQDEFAFIDLRPDGVNSADWNVTGKPKTNIKL